jgi:hypothetical protein
MREWLIAVYIVAAENHNGQNDVWYARMCMAGKLLERWYQITDPFAWMDASYVKRNLQLEVVWHMAKLHDKYFKTPG